MAKKTNSVVTAILEMADGQLRSSMIDKAEHEKIIVRHTRAQLDRFEGLGKNRVQRRAGLTMDTTHKVPKTEDITEGSGNVFADLGLPNADQELTKARLRHLGSNGTDRSDP